MSAIDIILAVIIGTITAAVWLWIAVMLVMAAMGALRDLRTLSRK